MFLNLLMPSGQFSNLKNSIFKSDKNHNFWWFFFSFDYFSFKIWWYSCLAKYPSSLESLPVSFSDYYIIHCLRDMALICFDLPGQFLYILITKNKHINFSWRYVNRAGHKQNGKKIKRKRKWFVKLNNF